ncbi:hypothetical protein D3C71_1928000 [compost metagenome]
MQLYPAVAHEDKQVSVLKRGQKVLNAIRDRRLEFAEAGDGFIDAVLQIDRVTTVNTNDSFATNLDSQANIPSE